MSVSATPPPDAGDLGMTTAEGITTLWLNRPAKRNAVTYEMWHSIAETCRQLANDATVRLLVIRGAGDHFCAGADIHGLSDVSPADYEAANRRADHAIATFPKPTIAYITGACTGGGTQIAVACDLRIADTTARFGITPARLGILYPSYAIERVTHLIGPSATKHLLYTAEIVDSERALRIGLIDEAHPPSSAHRRLDQLTDLIAHQRSLMTQMATKEMVDTVVMNGHIDQDITDRWKTAAANSPDPAQGITAFIQGHNPTFTWTPTTPT